MIEILKEFFEWILIILFITLVVIRNKKRGFFWKARDGSELNFKQFMRRWRKGIEGITPIQQTKTTLWSYPLVIGGVVTGIIIMLLRREWWLVAILVGSLPMTLMGILSTWQRYVSQKKIETTMKELEEEMKENKEVTFDITGEVKGGMSE